MGNFSLDRGSVEGAKDENGYNLRLNSRANKYLRTDSKVFGFGSALVEYRKLPSAGSADDPYVDVKAGAGYGRTVNATVLKQAVRMSEDFRRFNVTKTDLPDEALLKLARIIDREAEFQTKYGTEEYRKYWYDAMEKRP